ncbi:MAG: sulfite exporter TauE/SafE family protein [Gammaproteobacteria bacterium]|nr:sulfite exporter TauE/SafE family protein [Gammaproteobacteria bacterium]NNF62210.1 sulfite exporter TauE/SafE family protein [Gammaproteobacteria bacterium]NNM20577.1 sulfite exporter TauE/SafE family protein [Gammaproteobacteria bacterium]
MISAWLGAIAIGLSLGLLGSGGSIVTVPVLVYLFGQDEKVAIAGSLAIVGTIALAASLPYMRRGYVDWRNVMVFGLPGMLGTYLGAWLAAFVSGLVQLSLFALVMLAAAVLMLRPMRIDDAPHVPRATWKIAVDGLLVGVVTGLVGVGGGFLIIPALVLLGGLRMHNAVATSLVIIALKSYSGFYKYLEVLAGQDLALDWQVIALVTTLGVAGSLAGNLLATRLPHQLLKRIFGIFLVMMGCYILVRSLPQLVT